MISDILPINQSLGGSGGGQTATTTNGPEGESSPANGQEPAMETTERRQSLQAARGVAEELEGEGSKPPEGSAESDQVTTETDGEEGILPETTLCSLLVAGTAHKNISWGGLVHTSS